MTFIPTNDYFVEVARGKVPGQSIVNIQANNPTAGTSFEDIWDDGGVITQSSSAETWEMLSASAADTSTGTGTRTVVVESLDADYVTQTQIVTMNGTSAVALTGTHFRPRKTISLTAGSNTINVGDITLRVAGGGVTKCLMLAGNGASFNSHYTVPAGKTAFGIGFSFFLPKNDDAELRAFIAPFGTDRSKLSGGSFLAYQDSFHLPQKAPFPIVEKTDLVFQVKSGVASVSVTTLFDILLIDN